MNNRILDEKYEDEYKQYQQLLKSRKHGRAYECLEGLLHELPRNKELLEDIINLCCQEWGRPEKAEYWLVKLTKLRSFWGDYLMLSQVEATLDDIPKAKKYLKKAKALAKREYADRFRAERALQSAQEFIKNKQIILLREKEKSAAKSNRDTQKSSRRKDSNSAACSQSAATPKVKSEPKTEPSPKKLPTATYRIPIKLSLPTHEALAEFQSLPVSELKEVRLWIDYTRLTIQGMFDELLCLNAIGGINRYWYQIETVKKTLKYFHGRVLLCDEVGLGKTIEAGMLIKEYLMRGMAGSILVLTPPPLVSQWKEEMQVKFGIDFLTTDDPEFRNDPEQFWKQKFIIASLNTAKSKNHWSPVTERFYDIVVVDEAHRLRNRTTLAWKLVNQIKKKFIFLLTATPVQNNLIELYNLITLLKPGQFKTEKVFKQEYVKKGNLRVPVNREKLKGLLRDVMIRNTRSVIDLKLPNRFATTIKLEPPEVERMIYQLLGDYLRKRNFRKHQVNLLLREAGSSPFALLKSLQKMPKDDEREKIADLVKNLHDISKGRALVDILKKRPREKKIVFTQYLKSLDYLTDLLDREKINYTTFSGKMSTSEKNRSIADFKNEAPVLLSTESGGEGRNLQFCRTIVNFDLPWNPMKIEQRIGRLHRIGQTRDVFIFNLSVRGTIEDYIVDILDNKINMFEMVIGEIEPILGQISTESDFEDIILDIWLESSSDKEVEDGFEKLGQELIQAKKEYFNAKALDAEIFGEDYET